MALRVLIVVNHQQWIPERAKVSMRLGEAFYGWKKEMITSCVYS
jgi:hypothetical protein